MKGKGPRPGSSATSTTARAAAPFKAPRPPAGMGRHGRRLWRELYGELVGLGLLTTSDVASFSLLCFSYDVAVTTFQQATKEGFVVSDGRGQHRKHPALQISRDATATYQRLAREFALTPLAAARLGLEVADDGSGDD